MADDATPREEQAHASECYACPIGSVFAGLQRSNPEATVHLVAAGREFIAALRHVLDGFGAALDEVEHRPSSTPVENIPIRRDPPGD